MLNDEVIITSCPAPDGVLPMSYKDKRERACNTCFQCAWPVPENLVETSLSAQLGDTFSAYV